MMRGHTWHGGLEDLPVVDLPDVGHVHHGHPAHRAGVVAVRQHLVKTRLQTGGQNWGEV